MKFFIVTAICLFGMNAFALENLAQMKSRATTDIDKQIMMLKEKKTCVMNASSSDVFKSCGYEGAMPSGSMQRMEDDSALDVDRTIEKTKTKVEKTSY